MRSSQSQPLGRGESAATSGAEPSGLLAPPFTRKTVGRELAEWSEELLIAHGFAEQYGLRLERAKGEYQVAKLVAPGVCLVIYPHKTSASNYHLRVRNENSKDARRAQALMALLDYAAGFNCTFSFHWPANPLAHAWHHAILNPAKRAEVEAFVTAGASELARSEGQ